MSVPATQPAFIEWQVPFLPATSQNFGTNSQKQPLRWLSEPLKIMLNKVGPTFCEKNKKYGHKESILTAKLQVWEAWVLLVQHLAAFVTLATFELFYTHRSGVNHWNPPSNKVNKWFASGRFSDTNQEGPFTCSEVYRKSQSQEMGFRQFQLYLLPS